MASALASSTITCSFCALSDTRRLLAPALLGAVDGAADGATNGSPPAPPPAPVAAPADRAADGATNGSPPAAPTAPAAAPANTLIHGKALPRAAVMAKLLHRMSGHLPRRDLIHLPDAWCNAPPSWTTDVLKETKEEPCEACVRANAPRAPPGNALPAAEGLYALDIFHIDTPAHFGGQRTVVGRRRHSLHLGFRQVCAGASQIAGRRRNAHHHPLLQLCG